MQTIEQPPLPTTHPIKLYTHPLKQLSYSAINSLHFCPRAFELGRMGAYTLNGGNLSERRETVHMGYGSAFGSGLQALLCGKTLSEAWFEAIKNYRYSEIYPLDDKLKTKSLFYCLNSLTRFKETELDDISNEWEPLILPEGRPAAEVGFAIQLPNGYYYRGFVDFILQHKVTKKLLTTEIKTSGATVIHESSYKLSLQGTVYAIVSDYIAHLMGIEADISCVYIVQATTLKRYETFNFPKTAATRISFLKDTLSEVSVLEHYASRGGAFPKYGNCHGAFNSTCEFYGICEIDHEFDKDAAKLLDEVDYVIPFEALYQRQVDCLNKDTTEKLNQLTNEGHDITWTN